MRAAGVALIVLVRTGLCIAGPSFHWAEAEIPSPQPHTILMGEQLFLDVDLGVQFTSIDNASITFVFEDDLWDLDETIGVFFPGEFGYIGIASTAHDPYDPNVWSTTLMWEPASDALMDGASDFYVEAINGSVGLQSCTVEVWGEVVPEPSTLSLFGLGIAAFGFRKLRSRTRQIQDIVA